MSRVIAWFVHNPVAANLFMVVLLAGGALALPQIHLEEFPSIEIDMVTISVAYPGASPEEIEQSVCIRLEEAVEGTPDVDRINSVAVEGVCAMYLEAVQDTDMQWLLSEIENRVDAIDSFPVDAERPIVARALIQSRVLQVAIAADADEGALKEVGQRARDEIAALPAVSQVSLKYTRPYEVSIEVSEEALRRHGLTFDQVAAAVRDHSLDLPGGSVKTTGGEILFRTVGQARYGTEFEEIVVLAREDGTSVLLAEVADVIDGFEDVEKTARFRGKPAVLLQVERVGEEDVFAIAGAVKAWLPGFERSLPEGFEVVIFSDDSQDLQARLDALIRNARSGILLVLLILALFLRFRLAMWVAAGVPIALAGAIAFFPSLDLSISTLTIMAFILVLGILVDDAIVIGESVYSHEQRAESQVHAAISGTREVSIPVIFGVMTSVAAFLPLMMVGGHMGRFFGVIGWTAILCLAFSLIESQLILPAHLAHRRTAPREGEPNAFVKRWSVFQGSLTGWLERLARVHYGGLLARAIEWRYVTAAIAVGIVVVASALLTSGRLRYQFFPSIPGDIVYATLTMPQGVPQERTEAAIGQLEEGARELERQLIEEYGEPSLIVHTISSIGEQLGRDGPQRGGHTHGAHLAEMAIELTPAAEREITSLEVASRWRDITGPVADAVELAFSADSFSAGEALNYELRGPDVQELTQAAEALKLKLASYAGVTDIADSFRAGKQEVQIALLEEARPLGLTQRDLARQVRQAFWGEEAQRMQRGRDDVKVMVRYPADERRSLGALEEMRIRTGEGVEVPFASVADASLGRGYATIRRVDRQRVVFVTAEVDRSVTTPEKVVDDVNRDLPGILAQFPSVSSRLGGEQEERSKASASLVRSAALSLLIIYALLAIPLKSYFQPLVIMAVIPFGTVGAIVGHWIMGWDLVFFSVLGIVALSGVVVNASLVMVHYVNRQRERGMDFFEAVTAAGIARFRPIVLTSVTTFIGLVPLMFEAAPPAKPLIPMAISLGYGVLLASTVTLFLVPCGYVILDDLGKFIAERWDRWRSLFAAPFRA